MCDMVYISGLVVVYECLSLFDYCDVVIIIMYKLFCGFCGGMVFFWRGMKFLNKLVDG